MGTSKSYEGANGNPNWSHLSGSVTRACDTGTISNNSLSNVASNFAKFLGGSSYGGRGRSKIGGRAGIRTAQRLGGFLGDVKSNGFRSALSGIGFDVTDTTKPNEAINYLLEYCAGVASSLDETAAKAAERQLLEEIGSEAKDFEELVRNFEQKIEEYGIEELLVKYFAYYIYEHLSIDFYEKLIEEKGEAATTNFYTQLRKYLVEKVKNISRNRDLSKIDWAGKEGDELVKNIFEDTLKAFENYES
jgi:ADP-ribose pyrophosphatase YjhB (NUDIX family)